MYLDYSKLEFDKYGNPEMPELVLQTLGGKVIGTIPGVHNLKFNIKYSEPSEISFDVPAKIDGEENPIYKDISGYKLVYTKCYGIYEIISPKTESDGSSETKHVTGYSCEKTLESKKFFLEEGTFNFWNPVAPTDTVLGRLLEIAVGWSAGYVSPSLIGRYRTFDSYDDYLLSFIYNKAPEKYRCVFVFDTYNRTINVYDADEEITNLPIYLDFDNLLESVDITEKSDELVTAIRPYGADELDIRAVNPIGTNWIYDLSYFISNGDISGALAEKWTSWQRSILNQQMYYKGLVSLQASSNARLLSEEAKLTDLNGELDSLVSQQSVTIQAIAMETTEEGKEKQQDVLDTINANISAKRAEISSQEAIIAEIKKDSESYAAEIQAVVNELSIQKYFSDSEYKELSHYLIEQDITEETFVASSVDTSVSGNSYSADGANVSISGSAISMVDLQSKFSKKMYVVSGGTFTISEGSSVSGDIIRGTLETKTDGNFVMSFYAGTICVGDKTAESGVVTISGIYSGLSSNISEVTVDDVTTYEGTTLRFDIPSGSMFLTANISEYQKYSVQMELFDYAVGVLSDLATPTYEFEVDSGNFLFAQEFDPFRNELELGKGVYLSIGSSVITPYIIEIELDFEERSNFSLVFSNRFKRPDETNTLKDMIETSYSSSRSFDASKYIIGQTTSQTSMVSEYLSGALDAAKNAVIGGSGTVKYDSTGLTIGVGSQYQIRMVDRMIAMTDDNWEHAKVAIGLVSTPDGGSNFIVNAEVIGGKLIIGNNLVIENVNDEGVMQFKVDSSGAWLNNSTFVLQKDGGGKLILDPKYGIVGGTGSLYTTSGTTVIPSFVDSNGSIILDDDGIPKNANFYLDLRDGSAYFRGKVTATSGKIGGFTIEDTFLHGGSGSSYVALHGSGAGTNSAYAIWAGATSPASAPFYVMKNGNLYARNGTFSGTLSGAAFKDKSGNSMMNGSYEFTADYLNLNGINVGNGNFVVDSSGNVSIRGSITMAAGSSINWALVNEQNTNQSAAYSMANTAYNLADSAYSRADSAYSMADSAYDNADYAYNLAWENRLTDLNVFNVLTGGGSRFGIFSDSTSSRLYINASYIRTGAIDAGIVTLENEDGGFCCARGSDGVSTTYGAKVFGSAGIYADYYLFVSNKGAMMKGGSASIYCASNGIHASDEVSVDSDARLKKDIRSDIEKYEDFFLKLCPSTFVLSERNDGMRHIGFIAQDVAKIRDSCGLSEEELALLELCSKDMPDGTSDKYYSIRYGELIPLCVHMIQKLYGTVVDLKSKLKKE